MPRKTKRGDYNLPRRNFILASVAGAAGLYTSTGTISAASDGFNHDFEDKTLTDYVAAYGAKSDWDIDSAFDGYAAHVSIEEGTSFLKLDPDKYSWSGDRSASIDFKVDTSNWKRNARLLFEDGADTWIISAFVQGDSIRIHYDEGTTGDWNTVKRTSYSIDDTSRHTLSVDISGTTFTVTLDDDEVLAYNVGTELDAGSVGFGVRGDIPVAVWFDNFTIIGTQAGESETSVIVEQGDQRHEVTALSTGESIEEFYDYYNARSHTSTNIEQSDASLLFFWEGPNGLSLVILHDEANDGSGAACTFEFIGLPTDQGHWILQDDSNDFDSNTDTSPDWTWADTKTDGGVFRGGLDEDFEISINPRFNEDAVRSPLTPGDITEWQLLSRDASSPERIQLDMGTSVTIRSGASKPSLKLEDVRLVQTVEKSRIEGTQVLPDPDFVKGRNVSVQFGLKNDPTSLPDKIPVRVEYSGIDRAADEFSVNRHLQAVTGSYPVFKLPLDLTGITVIVGEGIESMKKDAESTEIPGKERSIIDKPELEELNIGFIGINDPGNYPATVKQAAFNLQDWYPTARVNVYEHTVRQKSTDLPRSRRKTDAWNARNSLDEELPVTAGDTSSGRLFSIVGNNPDDDSDQRLIPEKDLNLTIEDFDVTIGIVPDGYQKSNGTHWAGSTDSLVDDPKNQPPVSAVVVEETSQRSSLNNRLTVVHEAVHHFLGEPYDKQLAHEPLSDPKSRTSLQVYSSDSQDTGITATLKNEDGTTTDSVTTHGTDATTPVMTDSQFLTLGEVSLDGTPAGNIFIGEGDGSILGVISSEGVQDRDAHATYHLQSNTYEIENGEFSISKDFKWTDSLMQPGPSKNMGIDSLAYQALIKGEFDPTPKEGDLLYNEPVWRFVANIAENDAVEIISNNVTLGGMITDFVVSNVADLIITDPAGNHLSSQQIPIGLKEVSSGSSSIKDNSVFIGHVQFPEKAYKIQFNIDGTETAVIPLTETLFSAVSEIPDNGFMHRPDERRKALNNKLNEVKEKMDVKEFHEAKQKLENDFRRMIKRWLKNEYEAAANEFTKQEMLDLVDDMIGRLETLAQTSS